MISLGGSEHFIDPLGANEHIEVDVHRPAWFAYAVGESDRAPEGVLDPSAIKGCVDGEYPIGECVSTGTLRKRWILEVAPRLARKPLGEV